MRGEGTNTGTAASVGSRSAPTRGGEGPAPLASSGATGALSPVNVVSGGPLEPVRTGAGRHVAAVGEVLAPAAAAAQGASSAASAGASEAGRKALEGTEALPASTSPVAGTLPSVTPTKPSVRIAPP